MLGNMGTTQRIPGTVGISKIDSAGSRGSSPKSPGIHNSQKSSPHDRSEGAIDSESDDSQGSFNYKRDLRIEDLVNNAESPGIHAANGFDVPMYRDKENDYGCLECVISAIVSGCVFGKLCLQPNKEGRTWLYNTIALTDTFLVAINKNDIFKMIENQKKRVLGI